MKDIPTVMLPPVVDSETSTSVETLMIGAMRPGGDLIVDGHDVTYMSAAGVRAFAVALHHAEKIGSRLAFCRFTGPAADCLLVSGFTALFEVVDSVEAAGAQLRGRPGAAADGHLHRRGRTG